VFCFNDLMAHGAMRAIHAAGLRVPEDVALVGFDDVEEAEYAIPSLTTVAPDKTGIAEAAVDALLYRIAEGYAEPGRLIQPGHRLVVRESSSTPTARTPARTPRQVPEPRMLDAMSGQCLNGAYCNVVFLRAPAAPVQRMETGATGSHRLRGGPRAPVLDLERAPGGTVGGMTSTRRTLGRSGIEVSALGLGCWAIGGPLSGDGREFGWGEVDDAASTRAVHAGLEAGVTFFDTASNYGAGHSEKVLGAALRGRRDAVVIASKWGNTFDEATRTATGTDATPEYLVSCLEGTLRRLGTDYVDLYQLHLNDLAIERALDFIPTLEDLVAAGKLRAA
jgi:hypothetical protein